MQIKSSKFIYFFLLFAKTCWSNEISVGSYSKWDLQKLSKNQASEFGEQSDPLEKEFSEFEKTPEKSKEENMSNVNLFLKRILDNIKEQKASSDKHFLDVMNKLDRLQGRIVNLKHENHVLTKQLRKVSEQCLEKAKDLQITASAVQQVCPDRYIYHSASKSCYKLVAARVTWRQARERCQVEGADLAVIESSQDQVFLNSKARERADTRHCDFWLSGTDKENEGRWKWANTGNDVTYLNWMVNEPNNSGPHEHCMQMLWVYGWAWNDANCNAGRGCYICQAKPW